MDRTLTSNARDITEHLTHLLNTRQGSLPHLLDYGLPDLNNWYQQLPDSLWQIQLTICEVIKKYEPRLNHVRVELNERSDSSAIISLNIYAENVHQQFCFRTDFSQRIDLLCYENI